LKLLLRIITIKKINALTDYSAALITEFFITIYYFIILDMFSKSD